MVSVNTWQSVRPKSVWQHVTPTLLADLKSTRLVEYAADPTEWMSTVRTPPRFASSLPSRKERGTTRIGRGVRRGRSYVLLDSTMYGYRDVSLSALPHLVPYSIETRTTNLLFPGTQKAGIGDPKPDRLSWSEERFPKLGSTQDTPHYLLHTSTTCLNNVGNGNEKAIPHR